MITPPTSHRTRDKPKDLVYWKMREGAMSTPAPITSFSVRAVMLMKPSSFFRVFCFSGLWWAWTWKGCGKLDPWWLEAAAREKEVEKKCC